ncbi:uncharacterized protein LOC132046474 [Lycium ferocissimum]|uniref:uncharacterized protein LOC132046474 n=1 Tax=Lycium ferocissimum TaxID=112874 RepID=UPI002815719A|nr:uncharacterized protein LOC132046474 [Lycium ferocissimum]
MNLEYLMAVVCNKSLPQKIEGGRRSKVHNPQKMLSNHTSWHSIEIEKKKERRKQKHTVHKELMKMATERILTLTKPYEKKFTSNFCYLSQNKCVRFVQTTWS